MANKKTKLPDSYGKQDAALLNHPDLKDYVGISLKRIFMFIRDRMDAQMSPLGLNAPMCGMLLMLSRAGSMTQVELGKCVFVDKATMVRFLDVLEAGGYVTRSTHATDRRAKVLAITAKGKKALEKASVARTEAENALFASLTKAEEATFRKIVQKLTEATLAS
jgi:DNA-binding MarR family transcriptional regulator